MITIDLENDLNPGMHRTLVSYYQGADMRVKLNLDQYDDGADTVSIIFPAFVWDVTPSFFRGMFLYSYEKLGKQKFNAKYTFIAEPQLNPVIKKNIELLHRHVVPFKQQAIDLKNEDDFGI
jgi:hypothetical protein